MCFYTRQQLRHHKQKIICLVTVLILIDLFHFVQINLNKLASIKHNQLNNNIYIYIIIVYSMVIRKTWKLHSKASSTTHAWLEAQLSIELIIKATSVVMHVKIQIMLAKATTFFRLWSEASCNSNVFTQEIWTFF